MTDNRRQFSPSPTGSAWGQTHLTLDAAVAFVDDELSPGARRRALAHLAGCGECAAEVVAQTQARMALRAGSVPPPPSSLLRSLRAIPSHAELPAAPAGLAVGPEGELVSMVSEPLRLGRQGGSLDRRVRGGTAAVVSGIALGALVMTATHSGSPSTGAAPGAPGGFIVDARLQLGGGVRDAAVESVPAVGSVSGAVAGSAPAVVRPSAVPRLAHQRWYR
ncbi:MAG: anti-sigma factor family protein [Pseudonocardia sp.]